MLCACNRFKANIQHENRNTTRKPKDETLVLYLYSTIDLRGVGSRRRSNYTLERKSIINSFEELGVRRS